MNKKGTVLPVFWMLVGVIGFIFLLSGIALVIGNANEDQLFITTQYRAESYHLHNNGTLVLQPNSGYTYTCNSTWEGGITYDGSNFYACNGSTWQNLTGTTTETDPHYTANNGTIARTGTCSAGSVVQNTTTSGVSCVAVASLDTDTWWGLNEGYLYNNSNSLDFNETFLNATIDARATGGVNNTMWNLSGTSLYPADFSYNVGIGTSSPANQFSLGDSNTGINQSGEDNLSIITGGTERIRVNNNGWVGIGASSPTALAAITNRFEVYGADGTYPTLVVSEGGDEKFIAFAGGGYGWFGTISDHPFYLGTSNAQKVMIDTTTNGGKVGIGDNSPDAQLDVQSSGSTVIGQIVQGAASQSANLQEWQNSSGGVQVAVEADGGIYMNPGVNIGQSNTLAGTDSIAIGKAVTTSNNNGIGIGDTVDATGLQAIGIGISANCAVQQGVCIGGSATATATRGVAIGRSSSAGASSTAIGDAAVASAGTATAIGFSNGASGLNSVAVGRTTYTAGANAVAIGPWANASHGSSIALGPYAITTAETQLMIGNETYNYQMWLNGYANFTGNLTVNGGEMVCTAKNGLCNQTVSSPGGSNTQVQFNDGGSFGGDANFTYNSTTDILTIKGIINVSETSTGSAHMTLLSDGSYNRIRAYGDNFVITTGASGTTNAINIGTSGINFYQSLIPGGSVTAGWVRGNVDATIGGNLGMGPKSGDYDTGISGDGADKLSIEAGGTPIIIVADDVGDEAVLITPAASTDIGLTVQGAASQSANLQEWQNSSGGVLSKINSAGELNLPQINDDTTPTLSFGDGDTGIFEQADDVLRMSFSGADPVQFDATNGIISISSAGAQMKFSGGSTTAPTIIPYKQYDTTGIGGNGVNLSLITGGVEAVRITNTQNMIVTGNITMNGGNRVCTEANGLCNSTTTVNGTYIGFVNGTGNVTASQVDGNIQTIFSYSAPDGALLVAFGKAYTTRPQCLIAEPAYDAMLGPEEEAADDLIINTTHVWLDNDHETWYQITCYGT